MFSKKYDMEAKPLNVMIVGCGKVGITLVDQLSREGNEITIVDKNADIINELTNTYDIIGYHGNGASYGVLREAGIENTDLFIAVTESDELNLLCCTVASKIKGCSTIARVRDPDYSREINYLREKLGLTMIINPEYEVTETCSRESPSASSRPSTRTPSSSPPSSGTMKSISPPVTSSSGKGTWSPLWPPAGATGNA